MKSDEQQISQLMEPLGLHHKRAQILMKFSSEFIWYLLYLNLQCCTDSEKVYLMCKYWMSTTEQKVQIQ